MPFSNPATYAGHSGVDFPGHAGEPILASGAGTVVSRGRNDRGGFFIWVQYDGGPLVGYHHMNSHDGCPSLGARVKLGQRLGYVGWTGHVVPAGRAGAHLHSEVSGHATTAGYWKFFDPSRAVGAGAAAGGGSVPASPSPKPQPTPTSEEDDMDPLYIYSTAYDRAYVVHPITGKKRALPTAEYEAAKLAGKKFYRTSSKVQVDEIPNA